MEAKLLVLCAMLASAAAGPVRLMTERSDSCATTCKPSTKFTYKVGTTYSYDYNVQTETSMDGASEERAALSISGQADIEIIDQCEHVLMMKNVRVHESNPSRGLGLMPSERGEELQRLLETSALRFSFQDGVMAELCPDSQEDPWALNVKRGLLSALQNSMDQLQGTQSLQEADVTGNCQTTYEVTNRGYWGKTNIKRNKNLMGCTERHGYTGSLQSVTYQMMSELQSVPLMTSEHECLQEVSSGIVQTSTCTEKHMFRPFSSEGSGAQTTVLQKLNYKSQQNSITSRKDWVQSRAEMTFDHGYEMKDSSEARARAESLLTTLCDLTINGIQPDVPRVFSQLVGAVKKLDRSDIRDIYRQLQRRQICSMNNERTKKFFMDALPMAGSSQSVSMMTDLLVGGDVKDLGIDLWLQSLAFIPSPTAEMIDSAQELLQSENLKLRAMLAVTTMVNNYCQKYGCSSSRAVDGIMQILEDTIGYRCSVNDGNIKTVLTTLKAIGNTGQSCAINILNRCLGYRQAIEVRVAAADAFRRMPCDADKSQLMSILRDTNEDSEIRIATYQQMMMCPTPELLVSIQTIIEDEPEESQVGAYIMSHLSNLMETSCPLKQDIKQMVKDIQLKKLFEQNPLKFSRNYEKSIFLQMVNSGVQTESNVIFAAQSPMPRSASANITVDLFGHSINMLELGGRLEGVEYLVETIQASFFGDGKNKAAKKKLDELKGSGYARIFGNELAYNRFQGISSLTSGKTFNLLDFLIKLSKDHDYSFTQSLQFLDSSMAIPTATGLPLTLSVNGTAVVDVKATGKMDLRKVSKTPRSVYVDGEIRPSGAINIDGVMSVDAMVTRTGLKMTGSMHSSLAMKGRVELDRGRVLNVQVDMPEDKLDILDVRSKFFILHNKRENEQKMIEDNRKDLKLCSGNLISKMTGLELCGQFQFPNASMQSSGPYFPLTGPSSVSLVLHKRDSHTGYKLLAKRVENKRSSIAQLSFDTPGSSVVRAVSFDMMFNYPQKETEISFASPWKKTSLKGSLMNDDGMKSLTASVVIDDDQTYSLTSEVKVDEQRENNLRVLTPMVKLRRPGADEISISGDIQLDVRGRSFSSDLTLNGATQKPLQVQASYTNTQAEKSVSGTFKHGKKSYSAQAGVTYSLRTGKKIQAQFNPLLVVTWPKGDLFRLVGSTDFRQDKILRSDITVTAPGTLDKPINFKCDITKRSRKRGDRYNVDVRLKSKPFTGKVSGFINVADTMATKLAMDYNVYRVGRDRVTLNSKLSNKSTAAFRKYTLTSSVDFKNHPEWNVQTSLDVDHKKKRSGGMLEIKLGKDPKDKSRQILLSASVGRKIPNWKNVSVDYKMKAIVPMVGLETSMNGAHTHSPDTLASKVTVKYAKGKNVKAEVNLRNKSDKQLRMNGDASLSFPGHNYEMDSSVKKSGRSYVHNLNMKTHNGPLMAATSTYKASKDQIHDVTSEIRLEGFKPIKVSGTAGLQWDNLQLMGQALHGKDTYSLSHLSKISSGPRGKWTVELAYPSRVIAFSTIGGLQKNSADLDLDFAWNKNKDDHAKVTVSMNGNHKSKGSVSTSNAKLEITSPFQPLEQLSASVGYDNDRKRYGLDGKLTMGDKSNTYYSTLNALKPLSPSNMQISWSGGSPIPGFKRLGASVEHSADPTTFNTILKASKGRSQMKVTVTGNDKSSRTSRDLSGEVSLKCDIRGWEDVTLMMTHKDDGLKYEMSGALNRNKDRYSAELDMTHSMRDWHMQNNGELKLISPDRDVTTNWQHRNSDDDFTTTLTSNWGRGKQLQIETTGSKKLTGVNKKVTGSVTVRSPWKSAREVIVALNHKMSDSHCKHTAALVHNGQNKASTELNYLIGDSDIRGDFSLITPYMEDKSGNLNIKYDTYPVTVQMQLDMAPHKTITGGLSFSKTADTDIEGNLRLTTPFRGARTVTLSGSTKMEGEDMLAKANLDYGLRKNYDIEVRYRPESMSLARVKVNTPLSDYSALNAGYQISGFSNDFDANADFVLKPVVGKYSASLNWQWDSDLAAKLKINTPITDLQYMQLTASSQDTPKGRKSRLEVDYYPRQVYALTSFYTLDMPVVFSLNVETPIQGYDNMGVSVRHQHSDTTINTHGELQYLPDRMIESTLSLNWARNVDGSLMVKTPFEGYEESKLSLRHDGGLYDFTSHAEAEFMKETMTADAQLNSGYTTSGSFSLESSLEDMEKVEANFNMRGDSDNFKSSASAAYGNQKMQGTLQHRFNLHVLKTFATFSLPFTKNIKTSVDMSNKQGIMQATLSGQYGAKKVESKSTLQMDQPDFSASSTLNYRLDGRPQEITATVSKNGEWDNMQLAASFLSPFTKDAALSVKHAYNLPYSMENTVTGNYGRDYSVKSVNSFNNRLKVFSASSVSSYKLGGPMHEVTATVSKDGDMSDVTVSTMGRYDSHEMKVEGELKKQNGDIARLSIKTPFKVFESMDMVFTHFPSDTGFSQRCNITYTSNDKEEKILHTADYSQDSLHSLQVDTSLISPFFPLERNFFKLRHNYDEYRKQCTGSATVDIALGKNVVTYKRTGDWDQITLEASFDNDDRRILDGHFNRLPLTNGYKHDLEITDKEDKLTATMEYEMTDEKISSKMMASIPSSSISIEGDASLVGLNAEMNSKVTIKNAKLTNTATMAMKKTGPMDDVTMEMQAGLDGTMTKANAQFRNSAGGVSGMVNLNLPIEDFSNVGGSFQHSGDLNSFKSEGSLTYKDSQEISGKASFYRYEWSRVEASAELNTPFPDMESTKAEYRHAGSVDSFTCSASVEYGNGQKISSDLRAATSPKYDMTLTVKTPFREYQKMVAEAMLESMGNSHTASSSLNLGRGKRYALEGSLDMDSTPMTASGKLTTPYDMLSNVEISGSHQGQIDDFSSSFVFNAPQTDIIKGDVMVKYDSMFDLSGWASLSSEISGLEDLRVEMKNTDMGSSKNGHFMARWAPQKQISMDGTYTTKDNWYNKAHEAELTFTTPFEHVRSAILHVQHKKKDDKYMPKVELTLNDKTLVDMEGELMTGDSPSVILTSRKPWPTHSTASLTREGPQEMMDVYVNWDRDENDKFVGIQTKAKVIQDEYQRDLDYSVKVTLPARTMSSGVTLLKQDKTITSEGFMAWDDRSNTKVYYTLELNDGSQYLRKMYDGTFKLGIPARTLVGSGSFSSARQTSALDAAFSWDADRDASKQVGFNAKVTQGDKTKADVTFRLPAIGKEVHIDHEMALNQGRTVWDGKTELSYSPDSSKTLTVASSLKDISNAYSSGKNYSLEMAISHPYTETDISFTSHIGATEDRYSAAMDTVYMTSRRQRMNMALRGEIDRLRRQMDLQLVSPMKKMSMYGRVESTEPYVIKVTNTYDDDDVIQSELNIDPEARSLQFSTNYDLDNPDHQLVLKAGYVNASAIRAELYRQQDGRKISDSLLAMRLKNPTLLHTRLAWRPQTFTDLQNYVDQKAIAYDNAGRETLIEMSTATGQELSDKYAAITKELQEELSPVLDLMQSELGRLGQQMERSRKMLMKLYRRNDFHLQDIGDYVLKATDAMREYNIAYRENYNQILTNMREQLDKMTAYDIREQYDILLGTVAENMMLGWARGAELTNTAIAELDNYLTTLKTSSIEKWEEVNNHPSVQHVKKRVELLGQDYKWLMGHVAGRVQQFSVPEQYTSAIYNARDTISGGLSNVMDSQQVKKVKNLANEVYQQGAWAYNYWRVAENTRKHLKNIANLMMKLVKAEFQDLTRQLTFLQQSNVTVWDPQRGELQMDVVLPIALKSLQEMPDFQAYFQQVNNAIDEYIPDQSTMVGLYNQYAPWVSNETAPQKSDIISELETYKPRGRVRGFSIKRRVRGM